MKLLNYTCFLLSMCSLKSCGALNTTLRGTVIICCYTIYVTEGSFHPGHGASVNQLIRDFVIKQ